jgi:hypothetical protein
MGRNVAAQHISAARATVFFPLVSINSKVPRLALHAGGGTMSNTKAVDCSQFAYRRNRGGSIDSICRICFLTAATADNEAQLHEREKDHCCWDRHRNGATNQNQDHGTEADRK